MLVLRFISVLLLSIFAGFFVASDSFASNIVLQMSPPSQHITLDAGTTYYGEFTVSNNGDSDLSYTLTAEPYQVSDSSYSLTQSGNQYAQIVDWVTFPEPSGELTANESATITYAITVPSDAATAGQYVLLRVNASPKDTDKSTIQVVGGISTTIYAQVSGIPAQPAGHITDYSMNNILFGPPILARATVINTGNIDSTMKASLTVRPLIGEQIIYSNSSQPATFTVLPETTRDTEISWDGAPNLGIFRVHYEASFLDDQISLDKLIFICPLWLVFVMIAALILFIIWCILKHRRGTALSRIQKF